MSKKKIEWYDLPYFHDSLVRYCPEDVSWEDVETSESEMCEITGLKNWEDAYKKLKDDAANQGYTSEWA